ncbi:aerobactin siderophore [Dichotomopilus funicola]|uniref:Aerobactin siderophore n=1 Tax=Dichotomopilus funicola TaxID=1934379 RepID=A0AAN6UWP3_9PEZI|nr:aerobactin siderophore [Dichotomopilus funicola]
MAQAVANYRSSARGETTKRLIAQLVNERLATLTLLHATDRPWARITGPGDTSRWMILPVTDGFNLSKPLRPNDFGTPVTLCANGSESKEDDPGSIFAFCTSWFRCNEKTASSIIDELRNSAVMLEKWMQLGSAWPTLNINSSFLDWERCLVTGHPTHPFHRTCFAHGLVQPVKPDDIPNMLNPALSFVAIPRSSVRLFGPFQKLLQSLLSLFDIPSSDPEIVVPCLSQHLPALLHFFPEATLIKTVANRAVAQAAIRTVSVPGYSYDLKLSLACLITSALRVLPCWSAAAAPTMTSLLKKLIPDNLWLCGEVAAVTGSQSDASEARYMTCILRENLESRAKANNEMLVLAAALMERPGGGRRTYAEILWNLKTINDRAVWFTKYVRTLLQLSLDPLARYGIGFEFHAQNSLVRVCRRTKAIKGFAIRDLAGVKLHGPTLEAQGFDLTNLEATATADAHAVWNRVHHALIQNHIGYMLYSLGLEGDHDGWQIVRYELGRALTGHDESAQQMVYRHFTKETMPFKSFIRMRMEASLKSSFSVLDQEVPNVLWKKGPWLRQVSLGASTIPGIFVSPEDAGQDTRVMEDKCIQEALVRNTAPYGQVPRAAVQLNPHPAVIPMKFLEDLNLFQQALAVALVDLVDRWWTDEEADFPSRMPLEPRAESLLRWVARGSEEGFIRPYKGNQGSLRPDVLIPVSNTSSAFQFRVCEFNGRFPINFLHYAASAYEALADTKWENPALRSASDYASLFDSLFQLFDPSAPIHFLSESSDFPPDSALFGLVEHRTGMRPRSVKPSSLRLIANETAPTGFDLYCETDVHESRDRPPRDLITVDGHVLEKVHQVGFQLYDVELFALELEMIRQIAMRSVNDMRTVFIAHDKRMLGIIRQELDALVHKHKVITPDQAKILRDGIIPTIIPGSPELRQLAEINLSTNHLHKDDFILKPFRLARGAGIVLGKHLSTSQWSSILESMQKVDFDSSATQYLLQPLLPLQCVDWFWDEKRGVRKSRMVGTYFSVNGQFIGFGPWRTAAASENVISASTKDVTVVMSVVRLERDE